MEDLVFEFSAPIAATMLDRLANTLEQMGDDAASYIKQASINEQEAAANEAAAASELATIPNYKEITVEETDEDGEVHEKKERVPDLVADAAARAAAWAFQQAAAALRAIAASLRGTASLLQGSITDGTRQKQQLSIGIENTQFAIKTTGNLLVAGLSLIKEVTSAFNVPQTDNKVEWAKNVGSNLLKIVGVDLSDGLGDELNSALEIAAKYAVRLGDVAFYSAVTSAVVTLGTVPFGNLAQPLLIFESNKIRNMYLNNDTGAKTVKKVMVSALEILGIDATPTVKGQTGNNNVAIDDDTVIIYTSELDALINGATGTDQTTIDTTSVTVEGGAKKTGGKNTGGKNTEPPPRTKEDFEKMKDYYTKEEINISADITRTQRQINQNSDNITKNKKLLEMTPKNDYLMRKNLQDRIYKLESENVMLKDEVNGKKIRQKEAAKKRDTYSKKLNDFVQI